MIDDALPWDRREARFEDIVEGEIVSSYAPPALHMAWIYSDFSVRVEELMPAAEQVLIRRRLEGTGASGRA